MTATVRLRPVGDWRDLREVRLRALADAPRMFGSNLARETAFAPADWRRRSVHAALAWVGADAVGTVGWAWTDELVYADLVGMWVAPSHRRQGVGAALTAWVIDDVVARRGAGLELGVVADNHAAVELYRRAGFVDVGTERGEYSGDLLRRMRYRG